MDENELSVLQPFINKLCGTQNPKVEKRQATPTIVEEDTSSKPGA